MTLLTPIRTTLAIEVELVLTANYVPGRLATSSDPPEDDELEDIDIEDILLNGVSILPTGNWRGDLEYGGLYDFLSTLLLALGDNVNTALFAAADRDAD